MRAALPWLAEHASAERCRERMASWLRPRTRDPSALRCLAIALAAVSASTLARAMLGRELGERLPYTIFIASVALATRWGGLRAGVFATSLSVLAGSYFFARPQGAFGRLSVPDLVSALLFVATSTVVIAALEIETRARRDVEERDRLLQVEYQQRVRLERELEQARRLESLGRLAGGVAHDFNNLLTVVTGSAELLARELPNHPLLQSILIASERSTELTRQLLGLGRRQMMHVTSLSVNDAVRECLSLSAQLVPEDIRIGTHLAPESWHVEADVTGLHQILINLLTNARDVLPDGGTIVIETENVRVDERFAMECPQVNPGDHVVLRVRDSGPGMNEDTLQHIFEPFFTTKSMGKGTGLGLSVTYGVVKQLRGHISVSSAPGAGSVFSVYLPRARAEATAPSAPSSGEASRKADPLSVLLVEDNELVRGVLTRMLQSLGHRVRVAADGEEALTRAATYPDFDVLLTDVVMPHMNGPQLAQRLGAERPGLAVIFMSGYAESVVLKKGWLSSGVLLKKPFSAVELERCLRHAVALRSSKRAQPPASSPRQV